ncbi:hypothetical protein HY404_01550 [Candidatus Microgenomates bacterium]|nr:hypothetical protein [Candidatus Microgenomates bacterium]
MYKEGQGRIQGYYLLQKLSRRSEGGPERGRINEQRALVLFRELVDEGLFCRFRRASKKQNLLEGIDFFGVIQLVSNDQIVDELSIPFQVKSSFLAAQDFRRERWEAGKKVIVVVVNEWRTDREIKQFIQKSVWRFTRNIS